MQYITETKTAPAYVPNVAADVVARTVTLKKIYLANVTDSAATVTIICKTGSLALWPTVSIAAKSVYSADLDVTFPGGINWVASAASAVLGALTYREN